MKNSIFITGLIILLVAGLSAQTEMGRTGVGFGPQLGFQKARDADEGRPLFGAALRAKLAPALGVEGSINYRQEQYFDESLTVRSWPVLVTGLIYPLPVVYGAIGAGWYNTTFDFDEELLPDAVDETRQEFGWHFGGGLEIPLGAATTLTGDIRYVFINYDFEEIPGEDVNSDFYLITIGVLFGL